jgi:hypothetical protein
MLHPQVKTDSLYLSLITCSSNKANSKHCVIALACLAVAMGIIVKSVALIVRSKCVTQPSRREEWSF